MYFLIWTYLFRSIYEWNIVTGKQSRIFQHPSKRHTFSSFATDPARTKLYAVGTDGVLFIWYLTSDTKATRLRPLKRRVTSRLSATAGGTSSIVQLPSQKINLEMPKSGAPGCNIPAMETITDTLHVDNGVIFKTGVHDSWTSHVNLDSNKMTSLTEKSCAGLWRLNSWQVLIAEKANQQGIDPLTGLNTCTKIGYAVYDTKTGVKQLFPDDVVPRSFTRYEFAWKSYHSVTGEMILLDQEENGICLWNPLSQKSRLVVVKVMFVYPFLALASYAETVWPFPSKYVLKYEKTLKYDLLFTIYL